MVRYSACCTCVAVGIAAPILCPPSPRCSHCLWCWSDMGWDSAQPLQDLFSGPAVFQQHSSLPHISIPSSRVAWHSPGAAGREKPPLPALLHWGGEQKGASAEAGEGWKNWPEPGGGRNLVCHRGQLRHAPGMSSSTSHRQLHDVAPSPAPQERGP